MKNFSVIVILLLIAFSSFSQAVGYEILGTETNPKIAWFPLITLDTLQHAQTLQDINRRFKPSWVARYISVELAAKCGDQVQKATAPDDTLNPEQLAILRSAKKDCTIDVTVDYIPENELTDNPPRQLAFSLNILPIYEAKFPGGNSALKAYLKENIIEQIPETTLQQIAMVKIRFHIDENGQTADVRVFTPSHDNQMDQFLVEALCDMPPWQPAINEEGVKIPQEFEFSMGTDMLRCDYYQY